MTSLSPRHDQQAHAALTDVQRIAAYPHAIRLRSPFAPLLARLTELGSIADVTGNASALLEKDDVSGALYLQNEIETQPHEAVHLRIFDPQWEFGFAVMAPEDTLGGNAPCGFQFFDRHGNTMHKIRLHAGSNLAAFKRLTNEFAAPDTKPELLIAPPPSAAPPRLHYKQIDIDALRADWAYTHSHHDFIKRQEVFDQHRLRKLRLAGKAFAYQVANDSVRAVLQRMTEFGTAVMTQVGNAGIVQTYYGKIKRIRIKDSRLNIMNAGFRMHLREDHIDSVWVAKKPTTDGIITSLELFNRQGAHIASFLSKKGNGQPEPYEWRDTIMRLLPIFGA